MSDPASSLINSHAKPTHPDANWGRILCAVGYTPLPEGTIDPARVSVSFLPAASAASRSPLVLLINGEPAEMDEARASAILAAEEFEVRIDLGVQGGEAATYWTCDLSHVSLYERRWAPRS